MQILNKMQKHIFAYALVIVSLFFAQSQAAGLLTPSDGSLPALDIQSHKVDVTIEDGYAITKIEQVFFNPHNQELEAIYSFPLPEKASAAEFTLWIDGKPITAEVLEKKQAEKIYEEEKAAGRDAGLAEKDSYKTFELKVAPVRAGQQTKIHFVYIQPVHIDTGLGRYVYPLEEGGVDEEKLAFWAANDKVTQDFEFNLLLKSAYPVDAVRLPNHAQAAATQLRPGEWAINMANNSNMQLQDSEEETTANQAVVVQRLDKDIVVYWRHSQDLPGSVDLITHKADASGRGTFMMVVTPGDDLPKIEEGIDWVFVLDISGSMNGKYATLAEGVKQGLQKMRSNDRFRIILFNNSARELTSSYVNATAENVTHYIRQVEQTVPGGGTNLYAGLKDAIDALDSDRTAGIILVTDGVANVGETEEKKFLQLMTKTDVRLFTFVMGNSANRPMLQNLTKASNGFTQSVSNSDDIVGQILLATSKITHQALHGVEVNITGVKTADLTPEKIGSLYRGQQLIVFGHYWGSGMADVTIKGKISGTEKVYSTRFAFPETATENPEIERLWAFSSITDMQHQIDMFGEQADIKQAITDLAIEYGLVTDYTSMLVVSEERFKELGIERVNQKRLETEQAAQQNRASRPAQDRRVDQAKPISNSSAASLGAGGAMNIGLLFALSILMLGIRLAKRAH